MSIPQGEIMLEVKDGGWRGGDLYNFYFQHYEFIMGGGRDNAQIFILNIFQYFKLNNCI